MNNRELVLDANILIRAVLGTRARELIFEHATNVALYAPDVAYADARKYLPPLLLKRAIPASPALEVLAYLEKIVRPIDSEIYSVMKASALERISVRDVNDWPIIACALILNCPIWTEDTDFFGSGIATWTTDRIGLYLA